MGNPSSNRTFSSGGRKSLNNTKSLVVVRNFGRMMRISDLPRDLVGEIFSRVPLTCLIAVRFTCKTWNGLSKKQILGTKAARKNQFLEFMIINSRVCSLRFDLQGILNDGDLADVPSMKHISKPNHQVEVSQVFHCDGLLLCVTKDQSRLFVCNPYLGGIRWIQPPRRNELKTIVNYALGYDNNNRNHKIMRQFNDDENNKCIHVYDFSSDSWRVLDVYPEAEDILFNHGVSLKGNTYFFWSRERFGSRLPLPFHPQFPGIETLTLSWVKDEKFAVLYRHEDFYEIWITTEIEPNAVSWNTFLTVDLRLINALRNDFPIYFDARSFFIDEEKKVAVLIDKPTQPYRYQMAYIIGEDGYFKPVNMGQALNRLEHGKLVCSSYVPSLVQLQINQLGEMKDIDE